MQTFLPYKNFSLSAQTLDYKRLGKQRVEAFQVLNVLLGRTKTKAKGWLNHPITKMWTNYENALKLYTNVMIDEWINRGYNNTMKHEKMKVIILNFIGTKIHLHHTLGTTYIKNNGIYRW